MVTAPACWNSGCTLKVPGKRICCWSRLSEKQVKNDAHEPRICHTEWTMSERKEKILYANSYIWNLEKWDWITYSQGRNRDADAENALVDTVGGGQGETVRQQYWHIHHHVESRELVGSCYIIQEAHSALRDDLEGWRWGWEGGSRARGYRYTYGWIMNYTAESNTTL